MWSIKPCSPIDLLTLTFDQTPLNKFSPDAAIDLLWSAKVGRPNQQKKARYKKHSSASTCTSSGTDEVLLDSPSETHDTVCDSDTCILDNWDNWIYSGHSDLWICYYMATKTDMHSNTSNKVATIIRVYHSWWVVRDRQVDNPKNIFAVIVVELRSFSVPH